MAAGETTVKFALLMIVLLAGRVYPFKLQISPRHLHHSPNERVRVLCQVDEPITSCEFRSFYKSHYDLNAGQYTPAQDDFKYYGNGLENGDCGIDLKAYGKSCHDILECRVRTVHHGWKYASALIEINQEARRPAYNVHPFHAHVTAGTNITALGHSEVAVNSCSYKWIDDAWIHFDQSTHLELPESDRNLGNGLENGDCAVTLPSVKDSGFVVFLAFRATIPRDTAMSHMTVFVYKAPGSPQLQLDKEVYRVGDELRATCTIKDSRPVANMTWYLGHEFIRNDTLHEDDDDKRWRWSYDLQEITQRVTRKLTWEDHGKELVCRAGHLALPGGHLDSKHVLNVKFVPHAVARPAEMAQLTVGENGSIKCRYFANPPPVFTWNFETKDGSAVAAKRYNISSVEKVHGHYESTLWIYNLTAMDDGQTLYIAASNSEGSTLDVIYLRVRNTREEDDEEFGFDLNHDYEYDYHDVGFDIDDFDIEDVGILKPNKLKTTTQPMSTTEANRPSTDVVTTSTSTTPNTTAASTTVSTTTMMKSSTTASTKTATPATESTTKATTTSTRTITTKVENVTLTAAAVHVTVTPAPIEEIHGTSRKVGLTFGILGLLVAVVGISFFIYKRSTKPCLTGLPYAHFRRARVNDGEEECFNVNGDEDATF